MSNLIPMTIIVSTIYNDSNSEHTDTNSAEHHGSQSSANSSHSSTNTQDLPTINNNVTERPKRTTTNWRNRYDDTDFVAALQFELGVDSQKMSECLQQLHEQEHVYNTIAVNSGIELDTIPQTYQQATSSIHKEQWIQSMQKELAAQISNQTWEWVPLPKNRKTIGCRYVYTYKTNGDGETICKSRLVVQDFNQQPGTEFKKTKAPVIRDTTLRTLLSIAAVEDWDILAIDFDTAFLNAPIEDGTTIYMEPPPNLHKYDDKGNRLVCLLKKNIYGLKQSAHNWNSTLSKWLTQHGFRQSTIDNCLYIKRHEHTVLIVKVYVDDEMIFTNDTKSGRSLIADVKHDFKIKDLGDLRSMIGLEISRDRAERSLTIKQTKYIEKVLNNFNFTHCKPIYTPAAKDITLTKDMAPTTTAQQHHMQNIPYREIIGSTLYAAVMTRPDISSAVRAVSKFMKPWLRALHSSQTYTQILETYQTSWIDMQVFT
jgi:Reverse transcriptase (RNA-dependent DNA polymerase)